MAEASGGRRPVRRGRRALPRRVDRLGRLAAMRALGARFEVLGEPSPTTQRSSRWPTSWRSLVGAVPGAGRRRRILAARLDGVPGHPAAGATALPGAGLGAEVAVRGLRWAGPSMLAGEVVLVLTGRLRLGGSGSRPPGNGAGRGRGWPGGGGRPPIPASAGCRAAGRAAGTGRVCRPQRGALAVLAGAVRRPPPAGVPPAAVPLSYDRAPRPMSLLLLAMAVVELIVIELALPWPTARLVLLILGGARWFSSSA